MSEQESGQVSEQEKEAIEYLKKHIIPYNNINGNIEFLVNDVLLNLIDKLQNENEKLKKNEIIADNRIAELSIRHGNDRDKIRQLEKENQELKEKLDYYSYYKEKESQEFDERDYYEE